MESNSATTNVTFDISLQCQLCSSSLITDCPAHCNQQVSTSPAPTTISVKNGGPWGKWKEMETCNDEHAKAVGFQIKVGGTQSDETGVDGIRLFCVDFEMPKVVNSIISSVEGP